VEPGISQLVSKETKCGRNLIITLFSDTGFRARIRQIRSESWPGKETSVTRYLGILDNWLKQSRPNCLSTNEALSRCFLLLRGDKKHSGVTWARLGLLRHRNAPSSFFSSGSPYLLLLLDLQVYAKSTRLFHKQYIIDWVAVVSSTKEQA